MLWWVPCVKRPCDDPKPPLQVWEVLRQKFDGKPRSAQAEIPTFAHSCSERHLWSLWLLFSFQSPLSLEASVHWFNVGNLRIETTLYKNRFCLLQGAVVLDRFHCIVFHFWCWPKRGRKLALKISLYWTGDMCVSFQFSISLLKSAVTVNRRRKLIKMWNKWTDRKQKRQAERSWCLQMTSWCLQMTVPVQVCTEVGF